MCIKNIGFFPLCCLESGSVVFAFVEFERYLACCKLCVSWVLHIMQEASESSHFRVYDCKYVYIRLKEEINMVSVGNVLKVALDLPLALTMSLRIVGREQSAVCCEQC